MQQVVIQLQLVLAVVDLHHLVCQVLLETTLLWVVSHPSLAVAVEEAVAVVQTVLVNLVALVVVDLMVILVELEHLVRVVMVEDPLVALVAVAVEEKVA